MLPAQVQGGRAEGADARDADGFEHVHGDGELAPIRGALAGVLGGREVIGIDGHLDLEGEVVAGHV